MPDYIGFDDTDILGAEVGTEKPVRRFEALLPEDCRLWGVVRRQLLVDARIPYTSHNSSACAVVPGRADVVDTRGWLRPRLWGGGAVLPVWMREDHRWEASVEKEAEQRK
jgi:hypothetical protein